MEAQSEATQARVRQSGGGRHGCRRVASAPKERGCCRSATSEQSTGLAADGDFQPAVAACMTGRDTPFSRVYKRSQRRGKHDDRLRRTALASVLTSVLAARQRRCSARRQRIRRGLRRQQAADLPTVDAHACDPGETCLRGLRTTLACRVSCASISLQRRSRDLYARPRSVFSTTARIRSDAGHGARLCVDRCHRQERRHPVNELVNRDDTYTCLVIAHRRSRLRARSCSWCVPRVRVPNGRLTW